MNSKLVSILLAFLLDSIAGETRTHEPKQPLPSAGCDGAPPDAVLELPVPAAYWMQVVCAESGHTLAPIPGDTWLIRRDSGTFALPSESDTDVSSNAKASYFVSIALRDLTQQQKDDAPALFMERAGAAVEQPFGDVVSLEPA